MLDKNGIAKRIAREVKEGYYVNLGIGIPTLVANFVRDDIEVEFQSENGVLGMGLSEMSDTSYIQNNSGGWLAGRPVLPPTILYIYKWVSGHSGNPGFWAIQPVQNKTKRNKTKQNKNKTKQNKRSKTKQNKTKQNKT